MPYILWLFKFPLQLGHVLSDDRCFMSDGHFHDIPTWWCWPTTYIPWISSTMSMVMHYRFMKKAHMYVKAHVPELKVLSRSEFPQDITTFWNICGHIYTHYIVHIHDVMPLCWHWCQAFACENGQRNDVVRYPNESKINLSLWHSDLLLFLPLL